MPDNLGFIWVILAVLSAGQLLLLILIYRSKTEPLSGHALPEPPRVSTTEAGAHVVQLKLQALERLILFVERMSPERLIMRLDPGTYLCMEYAGALTESIRTEFEHNLSQQIYVQVGTWNAIHAARERITEVIHSSARELKPEENGAALARKVLSKFLAQDENPTVQALRALRKEAQLLVPGTLATR